VNALFWYQLSSAVLDKWPLNGLLLLFSGNNIIYNYQNNPIVSTEFLVSIFTNEAVQGHSTSLYTPYKKHPKIFCDVQCGLTTSQIVLTLLSRRQPITIDY